MILNPSKQHFVAQFPLSSTNFFSQTSLDHSDLPKLNNFHLEMTSTLAVLDHPIFIVDGYVASQPTTLRFRNHGSGGSTVSEVSAGSDRPKKLFSIDVKKTGASASRRVYRDASGNVIFELRRDWTSQDSFVTIPDVDSPHLAIFAPRLSSFKDKFDVYIPFADGKGEDRLEVRGQDVWKKNTYVYQGEDLVIQVRLVNLATLYMPFKTNEWDVHVAQGMDLALVSNEHSLPAMYST